MNKICWRRKDDFISSSCTWTHHQMQFRVRSWTSLFRGFLPLNRRYSQHIRGTTNRSSIIGSSLTDIQGAYDKFPVVFFVWALLLIEHTWNSSPLRSNLLRLQCTCCTVSTTSARPHGSPLVWACQWPSSQPLSSPQLSHNDSFWA